MKKNKKKIIIAILILVVIIIVVLGLILSNPPRKVKKEQVKKEIQTGISKNIRLEGYKYLDYADNYLILSKDKKIILKNIDTLEEIETEYDTLQDSQNDLILFKKDDKNILINTRGEELVNSKKEIVLFKDYYTNKVYYIINDTLYDSNKNKVVQDKIVKYGNFHITGNLLITSEYSSNDNIIINLNNKKSVKFISYKHFEDSTIVKINKNRYIEYDLKNNTEKEYQSFKKQNNGYVLSNNNESIYFDNLTSTKTDKLKDKIVLNDKYYIDYKTTCGKLMNSETNKLVTDGCIRDLYHPEENESVTIININIKDYFKSYVLLPNDDLKEINGGFIVSKDYLAYKNYDEDSVIICDMNGKEIENECIDVFDLSGKDNYSCSNGVYIEFLDEKLNVKDKYESALCEKDYCIVEKDNKNALLYNGKKILNLDNISINIYENYIVVENVFGINVLVIGDDKDLSIEELSINDTANLDLDIYKVIQEFKLENIKDIIYENEELFKKYAYVVMNNDNLNGYEKQVFDMFEVVVDNKEYLDENYFLYNLSMLKINIADKIRDVAGTYDFNEVEIGLVRKYKDDPIVYYHELMHFLDFTFNKTKEVYYSKDENRYLLAEEIDKYDKNKRLEIIDSGFDTQNNLITEAGAEYYMAKYFTNGKVRAYYFPCRFFMALNYLFGTDKVKEIFFSKNGVYELKNLFLEYGLSNKEVNNLLKLCDKATYDYDTDFNNNDAVKVTDYLVKIYNNKNKKKWTTDNEFSLIISSLLSLNELEYTSTKNKKDYIAVVDKYNLEFSSKLLEKFGISSDEVNYPYPYYYKEDNKTYIIIDSYKIEYDFKNNKAIKHEKIES